MQRMVVQEFVNELAWSVWPRTWLHITEEAPQNLKEITCYGYEY